MTADATAAIIRYYPDESEYKWVQVITSEYKWLQVSTSK
jgi:hypothetical protein